MLMIYIKLQHRSRFASVPLNKKQTPRKGKSVFVKFAVSCPHKFPCIKKVENPFASFESDHLSRNRLILFLVRLLQ